MTDNDFDSVTDHDAATDGSNSGRTRRPSTLLLLSGLAALLISGWALAGPFDLSPLAQVEFRWLIVVIGVIVGLVLVFSPAKRKK